MKREYRGSLLTQRILERKKRQEQEEFIVLLCLILGPILAIILVYNLKF